MDFSNLFDNTDILVDYVTQFGTVFCGGFTLTVVLHYLGYGIFKVFSLLNIKY
jgi:hypothetical protein